MKFIKKSLLMLALSAITFGTAQETITNESVVQMVELGFDDYMIIDKINTSDVKFDAPRLILNAITDS